VEKTEELSKIGKLKLDIATIKRELTRTLTQLGETVYQMAGEEKKPELWANEQAETLIGKIDALKLDIKTKEEELEKIRAEKEKQKTESKAEETSSSKENPGT
jgi:hypothetical protein